MEVVTIDAGHLGTAAAGANQRGSWICDRIEYVTVVKKEYEISGPHQFTGICLPAMVQDWSIPEWEGS